MIGAVGKLQYKQLVVLTVREKGLVKHVMKVKQNQFRQRETIL